MVWFIVVGFRILLVLGLLLRWWLVSCYVVLIVLFRRYICPCLALFGDLLFGVLYDRGTFAVGCFGLCDCGYFGACCVWLFAFVFGFYCGFVGFGLILLLG